MPGGRERSISVWDARQTLLLQRLDAVQDELERIAKIEEPPTRKRLELRDELETERQALRTRLAQLGPAPRAKMG